jgi:hypothetical protein
MKKKKSPESSDILFNEQIVKEVELKQQEFKRLLIQGKSGQRLLTALARRYHSVNFSLTCDAFGVTFISSTLEIPKPGFVASLSTPEHTMRFLEHIRTRYYPKFSNVEAFVAGFDACDEALLQREKNVER